MNSINNVINAIVKMRIRFHDVSIKTSKKTSIWKICGWSSTSTLDSFERRKSKIVLFLGNNTIQHVSKTSGKMVRCPPSLNTFSRMRFSFLSFPFLHVGLKFFGTNLIWIERDGLTFNGTVYHDTFQFKKSTNVVGSRKIGAIWSLDSSRILNRCKVPLVCKNGLTIVWNFEDLTELESRVRVYEFRLNHKRDTRIAIFHLFCNRDLTIEV
ncbi:hypothetical protein Tco_0770967 [Tanacetum coccineum]|uniref:Uncharacterized protein n=1 Tax=Tanacetum coccineum TaxID=301880 RepID=A0ABQ4ZFM6_9ASTR